MVKPNTGFFKSNSGGLINNVRINSNIPLMPMSRCIVPRRGMKQNEFLRRTAGNMLARITDHDRGGVISGLDCRPFNKRRHNELEATVEEEDEQQELKRKIAIDAALLEAEQAKENENQDQIEQERIEREQAELERQQEIEDVKQRREIKLKAIQAYKKDEQLKDAHKQPAIFATVKRHIGSELSRERQKELDIVREASKAEEKGIEVQKIRQIRDSEMLTPIQKASAIEKLRKEKQKIDRFTELKRKGELGEQRAKINKLRYEAQSKRDAFTAKHPPQPLIRPGTSMSVLTTKGAPPVSYMFDSRGSRFDFSDITGVRQNTEQPQMQQSQPTGMNLGGFMLNTRPATQAQSRRAPVMSSPKKKMKGSSLSGFMDYKKKKFRLF